MRANARKLLFVLGAVVVLGARCDQAGGKTTDMKVTSSAFSNGGGIPSVYTCQGKDISPPLAFSGVPAGAKSLVLIVDDPDAPDPAAPRMDFVHWVLYNLPASTTGLDEGVTQLPAGAKAGKNDFGKTGWGGPCPPIGRHRYFFRLHALDIVLPDLGEASRADVEKAMRGHCLASAELVGTYQKQ